MIKEVSAFLFGESIPYSETETPTKCKSEEDVNDMVEHHQIAAEILEAMGWYNDKITSLKYQIDHQVGEFPTIRKAHIHDIEIYSRCINRLESRYYKYMRKVMPCVDFTTKEEMKLVMLIKREYARWDRKDEDTLIFIAEKLGLHALAKELRGDQ